MSGRLYSELVPVRISEFLLTGAQMCDRKVSPWRVSLVRHTDTLQLGWCNSSLCALRLLLFQPVSIDPTLFAAFTYVSSDFLYPNSLQHTARTPQPYPITRFQSTGGSSSDSGSGTLTPRPIHYLTSNTLDLNGINDRTATTSSRSFSEERIRDKGDGDAAQGRKGWIAVPGSKLQPSLIG